MTLRFTYLTDVCLFSNGTQEAAEYVTCRKTTKTHRKTTSTYNIKMEFVLQKMSFTKKCWIKWYISRIEKYPSWIFKFCSHDEVIFVPDDITGTGCGEEYMFSNQTKF